MHDGWWKSHNQVGNHEWIQLKKFSPQKIAALSCVDKDIILRIHQFRAAISPPSYSQYSSLVIYFSSLIFIFISSSSSVISSSISSSSSSSSNSCFSWCWLCMMSCTVWRRLRAMSSWRQSTRLSPSSALLELELKLLLRDRLLLMLDKLEDRLLDRLRLLLAYWHAARPFPLDVTAGGVMLV